MILPTGRSRIVLLGTAVVVLAAATSFLVFELGTGSVSSWDLPIVRIGETNAQAEVIQTKPSDSSANVTGAASTTVSSVSPSGRKDESPTFDQVQSRYTDSTVRRFVPEVVWVENDWSTQHDAHDSRDRDGDFDHRSESRRR